METSFNSNLGSHYFNQIPKELKDCSQWVCWKLEDRDGKTEKVPVNVHTGRNALTNKPETWGTFKNAVEYFEANEPEVEGIGFVFTQKFS